MRSVALQQRIEAVRSDLTPSEVLIADALRAQVTEIAFSSAMTVSSNLGVSEATLIRFARTIGFPSYQMLQQYIRDEIRAHLNQTSLDRLQSVQHNEGDDDNPILASVKQDILNLQATLDSVNPESMENALSLIENARRLYVVGSRLSAPSALFAARLFSYILDDVRVVGAFTDNDLDELIGIDSRDTLLVLGMARPARRTLEIARYGHAQSAQVIAITDSPLSPLAEIASSLIVVESGSKSFSQSYTALTAITHALVSALSATNVERTKDRLSEVEKLITAFNDNVRY